MDKDEEIQRLIAPTVTGLGYELVRVRISGSHASTLQIMAERNDRRPMRVEDCVALSREISAVLDAVDPIAGEYELEVSSPGIDRPQMKRGDYERFVSHEARLEVDPPLEGRKRFHGTIAAVEGANVLLETEDGVVALPLEIIRKGKLVLTDRLIAAHRDVESLEDAAAADAAVQMNL